MKIFLFAVLLSSGVTINIEVQDARDRNEAFHLAADLGIDTGWPVKAIEYKGERTEP